MPNGTPGDHPVSDIVVYGRRVFSDKADAAIRDLARLMSMHDLHDAMDWFNLPPIPELEQRLETLLEHRRREAKKRGWEVP